MDADVSQPTPESERELRALLGVVRGLRSLAEGRLSGLGIAPGEYLADIYCIQRVATLLAMELSAAGRSLRRAEMQIAGREIHAIESVLATALERRGVSPNDCLLELAEARVVRRDGSPV
jgi:hypothetical protein